MSKETIKIESPNLIEFVYDIESKVKEGYSVDDTNEGIPQSWGPGLYTCTVSKEVGGAEEKPTKETPKEESNQEVKESSEEKPTEEASKEDTTEEKPKPKTTRTRRRTKSSK